MRMEEYSYANIIIYTECFQKSTFYLASKFSTVYQAVWQSSTFKYEGFKSRSSYFSFQMSIFAPADIICCTSYIFKVNNIEHKVQLKN
jgi:hypothetical protein